MHHIQSNLTRCMAAWLFMAMCIWPFHVQAQNGASVVTTKLGLRNAHLDHSADLLSRAVSSRVSNPGDSSWTQILFDAKTDWPAVVLQPTQASEANRLATWNWSAQSTLLLPVENLNDFPITLFVRLNDNQTAQATPQTLVGQALLPAHAKVSLVMALHQQDARRWGMRAGPLPLGLSVRELTAAPLLIATPMDSTQLVHISSVHLVVAGRAVPQAVRFGELLVANYQWDKPAYEALVDRFGQSGRSDWPEKVRDDRDLLKVDPPLRTNGVDVQSMPQVDDFGGWRNLAGAPSFKAGSFFRVQKQQGRWWLVSPQGNPFFSIGVNTVDLLDGATYIAGREFMFSDLPDASSPLARHYGNDDRRADMLSQAGRQFDHGRYFNFYTANLQRKYGKDYLQAWASQTMTRVKQWGFNTIGNWSHDMVKTAVRKAGQLTYVQPIAIAGQYASVKSGFDYWGAMPDPFDPRFADATRAAVMKAVAGHKDDPSLLGYFVDNELAWGTGAPNYSLVVNALLMDRNSPAKQALVHWLQTRYATTQAWQDAWAMPQSVQEPVRDWSAAQAPIHLAAPYNAALLADMSAMTRFYAEQYFRVVKQTLQQQDGNHLYLGSRFAALTPEAMQACAQWCDVLSINVYANDLQGWQRDHFSHYDKPILIGEFNFGSADRGPFWAGLIDVGSEAQRAAHYQHYLQQAAAIPNMVGVHWFQYLDQPATGRLLDGENAHFGLVSIADVPYASFVEIVRQANLAVASSLLKAPLK